MRRAGLGRVNRAAMRTSRRWPVHCQVVAVVKSSDAFERTVVMVYRAEIASGRERAQSNRNQIKPTTKQVSVEFTESASCNSDGKQKGSSHNVARSNVCQDM